MRKAFPQKMDSWKGSVGVESIHVFEAIGDPRISHLKIVPVDFSQQWGKDSCFTLLAFLCKTHLLICKANIGTLIALIRTSGYW